MIIMTEYHWRETDRGGILRIKREIEHCNGRNATPYMALVGKAWRRIYFAEDAYLECYIKCNGERVRVYLYE